MKCFYTRKLNPGRIFLGCLTGVRLRTRVLGRHAEDVNY